MTTTWKQLFKVLFVMVPPLCCCVAGGSANRAHAYTMSYELLRNTCPVLQEVLDALARDFVNPDRKIDEVPTSILSILSGSMVASVERLFKCFKSQEVALSNDGIKAGITKRFSTYIIIARVKMPTTQEENEFVEDAYVILTLKAKNDGSLISDGQYYIA